LSSYSATKPSLGGRWHTEGVTDEGVMPEETENIYKNSKNKLIKQVLSLCCYFNQAVISVPDPSSLTSHLLRAGSQLVADGFSQEKP